MILKIIVPVWGESFCSFFVNFSLPTLFSASISEFNNSSFVNRTELHIYSSSKDEVYLKSSSNFNFLVKSNRLDVRFHEIEGDFEHNYQKLIWCHQNAILDGKDEDAAYLFSNADVIYADGALQKCLSRAKQGYRAVMIAGLRSTKKPLLEAVKLKKRQDNGGIKFKPRELVSVCLNNLHSLSKAHIVKDYGNHSLGHYYWNLGNHALLARCFHIHPLFLWPRIRGVLFTTTIDHELVRLAVPNENEIWMVQDSDDIFLCEGSEENHLDSYISSNMISPPEVIEWASIWTNRLHRNFATRSILFRTSDTQQTQQDEEKASSLINTYLEGLSTKLNGVIPDGMGLFQNQSEFQNQSGMTMRSIKSWTRGILLRIGRVMNTPTVYEISKQLDKFEWQFERLHSKLRQLQTYRSVEMVDEADKKSAIDLPIDMPDIVTASARFAQNEAIPDPTLRPPPGYTPSRGRAIYRECFTRCAEYIWGNQIVGDILEFGTFRGYSARIIAELMVEYELTGDLYLFDSFQGLPVINASTDGNSYEVATRGAWFKGAMAVDKNLPAHIRNVLAEILNNRVYLYEGYFEDTLSKELPTKRAALVHIDCDLYESTRLVLDTLLKQEILQDGTVICFDDYNCNRANPNMGERRAATDSFSQSDRYVLSPWFSYGWHGQAMFVHDKNAVVPVTKT